jgi:hypothetical protein
MLCLKTPMKPGITRRATVFSRASRRGLSRRGALTEGLEDGTDPNIMFGLRIKLEADAHAR